MRRAGQTQKNLLQSLMKTSKGTRFPPLLEAPAVGKATGRPLVEVQHCGQTVLPALVKKADHKKHKVRVDHCSSFSTAANEGEVVYQGVDGLMPRRGPKPEGSQRRHHLAHREPLLDRRATLQKESRVVLSASPRPEQLPQIRQDHVALVCQEDAKPKRKGKRQELGGGSKLPAIHVLFKGFSTDIQRLT